MVYADTISCIVEDDGMGFDSERIFVQSEEGAPSDGKALGLRTMRERLELIGGALEVQSEEGQGATITVRIPAGKPPGLM